MAQQPLQKRTSEDEFSDEALQRERQLNISTMLRDIRKGLFPIICLAISCGLLFFILFHRGISQTFSVESTYVVTTGSANSAIENLRAVSNIANSFSRIVNSNEMRSIIAKDLGGDVGGSISSSVVEETNLLKLKVTSGSPRRAFLIIRSIMRNQEIIMGYLSESVRLNVLVSPSVPSEPDQRGNAGRRALLASFIALAVLIALAALRSWSRDTVRNEEEVRSKLGIRCLGSIIHEERETTKRRKKKESALLITRPTVSFPYTESIHRLTRKVRNHLHPEGRKVLLVTSVNENEGKSTIAANLALSLAGAGKRVLLMDLDMRKPSLCKIFDVEEGTINDIGEFLLGSGDGGNLIRKLSRENLYVILNTEEYRRSTEMLAGGRLKVLLDYLREQFDYVIIDSSPMQLVADAEVIAGIADASLLVVREHMIPADAIREALDVLRDSRAVPIGCVLNDARGSIGGELGGYQYGSDYGYRYGYGYGKYYGRYYGKYGNNRADRKRGRKNPETSS